VIHIKSLVIALVAAAGLCSACSRPSSTSGAGSSAAAPQPPPGPVAEIVRAVRPAPPVLFVGLDGADWQLLDDYIARGVMPNLAQLVREGTSGVLETSPPALSPLVWTSMMTGKGPIEHGILDFVQFDPGTGAREPITSTSRRVPAIWNMATAAGRKTAVFGMWATFPAEPVNGVIASDRLSSFFSGGSAGSPGTVYPPDREAWARDAVRAAEQAVNFPATQSYLPWLTDAEYRSHLDASDPYAHPISALRRILVETRVYDLLGRQAFERDHPDLDIIYLEGTDSIGHVFAPYAPPRQRTISAEDFQRYSQVPETYFRAIDAQLGEYRTLVERAHGVLMVASDHGFFWKDGRPETLASSANATAARWHRPSGIYLLWGAGIAPGGHDKKGSVLQTCATLLALTGLPPGAGLAGAPLPGAPAVAGPKADYQAAYHPPPAAAGGLKAAGDADSLAKLRSLGYIADAGGAPGRPGEVRTPGSYSNEGILLRDQGRTAEATAAFESALERDPNLASALWNLSDLLFGKPETADRSDALLVRAYGNDLPEGPKLLIGRAMGYQRAGQRERSLKLINGALDAKPDEPELWLLRGRYRVDAGDCKAASMDFQRAETLAPNDPAAFAAEGAAQMCAGDRPAARKALTRALELNPDQPKVRAFLNTVGRTP
jgi:Flp pilus assembly protein TadD